jgi:hypothetical protein
MYDPFFSQYLRIGLVVRIPLSHSGGRGSIPRCGTFLLLFEHKLYVDCTRYLSILKLCWSDEFWWSNPEFQYSTRIKTVFEYIIRVYAFCVVVEVQVRMDQWCQLDAVCGVREKKCLASPGRPKRCHRNHLILETNLFLIFEVMRL